MISEVASTHRYTDFFDHFFVRRDCCQCGKKPTVANFALMNVMFSWTIREEFWLVKDIGHTLYCWGESEVGIFDVDEAIESAVWITGEIKFDVPV
jgi:hypothetical protein